MTKFLKFLLLAICCNAALTGYSAEPVTVTNEDDERFAGWTEEQYKRYEDSICAILYPPVTACKADSVIDAGNSISGLVNQAFPLSTNGTHVPNAVNLDNSKAVGQIPIISGTSQFGSRTYEVPIEVYPGMRGFQPTLSMSYDSHRGNSIMSMGWSPLLPEWENRTTMMAKHKVWS